MYQSVGETPTIAMYQDSHHSSHSISPNCLWYDLLLLLSSDIVSHWSETCFLLKLCRSIFSPCCVDLLIRAITYRDGRFQLADEIVNVNGASLRYQMDIKHVWPNQITFPGFWQFILQGLDNSFCRALTIFFAGVWQLFCRGLTIYCFQGFDNLFCRGLKVFLQGLDNSFFPGFWQFIFSRGLTIYFAGAWQFIFFQGFDNLFLPGFWQFILQGFDNGGGAKPIEKLPRGGELVLSHTFFGKMYLLQECHDIQFI